MAGTFLICAATPLAWIAAVVERLITIPCHVSARAWALFGVARRSWPPFWLGFGVLTAVDTIAGWLYVSGKLGAISIWWIEVALLPFAIISIPLTRWAIRHWPASAETDVSTQQRFDNSESRSPTRTRT
jgi:hypothetical protein